MWIRCRVLVFLICSLVTVSLSVKATGFVTDPFATDAMQTNSQDLCSTTPSAPYPSHSYQYVAMQGCSIILGHSQGCPLPWQVVKENASSGTVDSVCNHEASYENSVSALKPSISRDNSVCKETVIQWRKSCL